MAISASPCVEQWTFRSLASPPSTSIHQHYYRTTFNDNAHIIINVSELNIEYYSIYDSLSKEKYQLSIKCICSINFHTVSYISYGTGDLTCGKSLHRIKYKVISFIVKVEQ